MEFESLAQDGPVIMTPKIFGDERGYFMETFRQEDFEKHCGNYRFVQDNQSKSRKNVLRGLHYQLHFPQGKLVRVISGEVYDVTVDLRRTSPNFGKSYSVFLDNRKNRIFWVPPGFAHGFFVLSDEAEFVYKCTEYYHPEDEYCILWNDPALEIDWPLQQSQPLLSEKDLKGKFLSKAPKFD